MEKINTNGTGEYAKKLVKKIGGWDHRTGSYVVRCTDEPVKLAYTINADGKTCTVTGPAPFKGPVSAFPVDAFKKFVLNIPAEIDGYKVTNIGDSAFSWCSNLAGVNIPNGVTSIGDRAFYYCRSLTSVVIPDGITSIGFAAFENCSSLTEINVTGTKARWIIRREEE